MKKPKVVISDQPQVRFDRKNAIIGATVLLVLIVAGAIWWKVSQHTTEPASKVPQYSGQALVDAVNKKYGAHDYAGVIVLLKGQKSINEDSTQLLLAGAYTNKGDNASALAIYDKLDRDNKLNESYAATAADAAERAQQYQKAIDFFKKAKDKAPDDAVDQRAVYDYKIAELEKKL